MDKPFRVLCLDGGGMRGLYTATLLDTLIKRVKNNSAPVDAGKAFDLIVGTSTGGILAIALAYGLPLQEIIDLYRKEGIQIFSNPSPNSLLKLVPWLLKRSKNSFEGQKVLRQTLEKKFQETTVKQLYDERGIAVCIPAVRMATKKAWVFKTPHISEKNRDDNYKLTDVCLATAAAPIILPLAAIDNPDDEDQKRCDVFSDGGLWANNPTLIGLIEALEITNSQRDIQIISVSTASAPSGQVIKKSSTNFGLLKWRGGIGIMETSLEAQASGVQFMAKFLKPHLKADIEIIRLAYESPSTEQAKCIAIDRADEEAIIALTDMGKSDAESILSIDSKHSGKEKDLLKEIIRSMPHIENDSQEEE